MTSSLLPSRWTRAAAIGATVGILWITLATILGELQAPFKTWLKTVFAHHWLGKGYIAAGLFLLCLVLFAGQGDADGHRTNRAVTMVAWTAVVCAVFLTAFFLFELSR